MSEQRRVVVGLDYETEQPWVWVPFGDQSADEMAEGYGSQFAVDVPVDLVADFEVTSARLDQIVKAIHAAAEFDHESTPRIGKAPCADYIGDPLHLPRGVIYDDCDACGWPHKDHVQGSVTGRSDES